MDKPEVNLQEQPEATTPVINYVAIFAEYSWWRSEDLRRLFAIVRIHWDFPDPECKQELVPTGVELLEVYRSETTYLTWEVMIGHFDAGRLVKFVPPIPAAK
ncbi:hypothetical protein [Mucilaginibacter sp. CSA2-8R]|uniref:hypothetical protein n=1 Tax=Mucilaginibacter sp. CSA2-8R TaxID=3141542 RepID=UPI00315DE885